MKYVLKRNFSNYKNYNCTLTNIFKVVSFMFSAAQIIPVYRIYLTGSLRRFQAASLIPVPRLINSSEGYGRLFWGGCKKLTCGNHL